MFQNYTSFSCLIMPDSTYLLIWDHCDCVTHSSRKSPWLKVSWWTTLILPGFHVTVTLTNFRDWDEDVLVRRRYICIFVHDSAQLQGLQFTAEHKYSACWRQHSYQCLLWVYEIFCAHRNTHLCTHILLLNVLNYINWFISLSLQFLKFSNLFWRLC